MKVKRPTWPGLVLGVGLLGAVALAQEAEKRGVVPSFKDYRLQRGQLMSLKAH